MQIHKNIREIRQQKAISQKLIADALNADISVVSNIENGKRELRVCELEAIANVLGMSVVDLITYPKKYIEASAIDESPIEAVLQIRLRKDKKDQVLKLIFGDNNIEILNK